MESLMAELSGARVSVSCMYPGTAKTNIARNSGYTTDQDAGLDAEPLTTPDRAARLIMCGMNGTEADRVRGRRRFLATTPAHFRLRTVRLVT